MPTPPLFSSVLCTACDTVCVCPGVQYHLKNIFCLHNFPFYKNPHSVLAHKKDTCPKSRQCPFCFSFISHIHMYFSQSHPISHLFYIWKQRQPADMVRFSDFSPFWLCVPAFQQVCLEIIFIFIKKQNIMKFYTRQ